MTKAESDRTRLLVVSPTFPYPLISGGKQRIYYILKELASAYDITLLTLCEQSDDVPHNTQALYFLKRLVAIPISQRRGAQLLRLARNLPRWILGEPAEALIKRSAQLMRAFDDLIATEPFDAIQLEYSQLIPLLSVAKRRELPTLLVAHDVSFISQNRKAKVAHGFMRWVWKHEARLMEHLEVTGWRRATRVVAMSQVDRDYILHRTPEASVVVIPNGVDTQQLQVRPEAREPSVVFVGWMRHLPNRDAIGWFLRDIWPNIRAANAAVRFRIIGGGVAGHLLEEINKGSRIDYLGFVDDVAEVVGSAWISVVPIRIGSGSRLKILESMALGTPVVSTEVGSEGIHVTPDTDILIGHGAKDFSDAVITLLSSPDRRAQLARHARGLVESTYDWQHIGELARRSYQDACVKRPTIPSPRVGQV